VKTKEVGIVVAIYFSI